MTTGVTISPHTPPSPNPPLSPLTHCVPVSPHSPPLFPFLPHSPLTHCVPLYAVPPFRVSSVLVDSVDVSALVSWTVPEFSGDFFSKYMYMYY